VFSSVFKASGFGLGNWSQMSLEVPEFQFT